MLAQCEHDLNARGILVTTSEKFGKEVKQKVNKMLETLPTKNIAKPSWDNNGEIILVDNLKEAVEISNEYAPEHLEISTVNNDSIIDDLVNYGSLFIGGYSAEVFGDYVSGTNHTLPTLKASRYTGGVWVGTFIKTCTHQVLNKDAVKSLGPVAVKLATDEGLHAHANAAKVRLEDN